LNNVRGISNIFLCPESLTKDENEILITNSFSSEIPNIGGIPTFIDSSDIELIREIYINAQIKQNFHKEQEEESQYRMQMHTFNIDNNYKGTTVLADFVALKNMEELFTEIVPNVKFKKSKGQYSFSVFDENGNVIPEEPLVLLDKIPIFDPNKIMQLDISQIEKVEVIHKTYILGANTFQGVIMLTTNTNNFAGIKFPESGIFIDYPTLEEIDYNPGIFKNSLTSFERIPDFRTTLYWNPHVKLSQNGYDFDFITSDRKGTYDIIVKGYSSNGQFWFGKKQINIQ
jgi:hypothetical protein